MPTERECGRKAIAALIAKLPGEYHNWPRFAPKDWTGNPGDWLEQAHGIVERFVECTGTTAVFPDADLNNAYSQKLSAFLNYLVAKTKIAPAQESVTRAKARLSALKAHIKVFEAHA